MTILLLPTEKCNFQCTYCFEPETMRQTTNELTLNLESIENSLKSIYSGAYHGAGIGIHGGEATLVGPTVIEELFKIMQKYMPPNKTLSLTTNAHLIDDNFIRMLKKYPVHIGVSMDGPPELNTLRGPDPTNKEITARYNKRLWKTLKKMRKAGISIGAMVVLHKENAGTPEKVDKLIEWIKDLADMGITSGRLNPMGGWGSCKHLELTNEELTYAWKRLFDATMEYGLAWNPFREYVDNLLGFPVGSCTMGQCNFFSTMTISVLPDGTISNCDRTFADDLHVRSTRKERCGRYLAMNAGDCKDCKYWKICGGGCPGNGIGGDWRRKSRFCESIYELYEYIGDKLKGLLPNTYLITQNNNKDPFKVMNYNFTDRPSASGSCKPKEAKQ